MAFPLKNLFGKKEEGEAPGVGQLVAGPETAFADSGASGGGAFPPGQSPFQQAPPTAAQAQAPSSPAATPPAFPDSGLVPLHSSANVAGAPAVAESPFISQPGAAPAVPDTAADESPFSPTPAANQIAAPAPAPAVDESPFGAPAGGESVASPFAAVEGSPFAGANEAAPEAAVPEPFATAESFPSAGNAVPDTAAASMESPFGAQDSSFSPPAPAAPEGGIASPFAADSPFASMPAASGNADAAISEPFPSSGAEVAPEPVVSSESPFALAGSGSAGSMEAEEVMPPVAAASPEIAEREVAEPAAPLPLAETPLAAAETSSPFAALPAISDDAPVEVELPLPLLIKPLGEKVIGFAPEKVPASVMTKVPLDLIKGQLSTGRVVLPLGIVIDGCAERFHKAFIRADRDAQVTVPIPDLYHHLPEGALAPVAPEPEPEPEEDLAAIFADEPEPAIAQAEPEPVQIEEAPPVAVEAAPAIESSISDDFASPFPPISAPVEEPVAGTAPASVEMPALDETSPAEASGASPFATPFTEAAASEEVPVEEPEPKPEPVANIEPEPAEPTGVLPPFSPFSEEPLPSDDSTGGGLSLPSFFDIATPDAEASEPAKAAEDQALEPFPEPTAFTEPASAPEPEPAKELPPLGAMVPPAEEKTFAVSEEAHTKPAADPMDAFAEGTTLSDIDAMDDLPELGDLDDLFPAEDPVGIFTGDTATPKSSTPPPAETSPLEDADQFSDFAAASSEARSDNKAPSEDVFSEPAESKLPSLAPIAPADPANVFDSAPATPSQQTEEDTAAKKTAPEASPVSPEPVANTDLAPITSESESEDLSFGIHESEDPRQVALRALFGVEGAISTERAVDLAAGLPGISACIFTGENSDAIGAGNLDSFASNGPAVFENVRGLVSAVGIDDAACFTIRTSGGTMSFFSEGDACLGVLHEEPRFEPGVREKLTIAARELAATAPAFA